MSLDFLLAVNVSPKSAGTPSAVPAVADVHSFSSSKLPPSPTRSNESNASSKGAVVLSRPESIRFKSKGTWKQGWHQRHSYTGKE